MTVPPDVPRDGGAPSGLASPEAAGPVVVSAASGGDPAGGAVRNPVLAKLSEIGASAQAAIPGLYAWAITVAPAAWSRGAPLLAKAAAALGIVALTIAPVIEGAGTGRSSAPSWGGPMRARIVSVWGFVLSSAVVWALAPSALSSASFDGVRGALGVVGWALFAFASAGPALRADPESYGRIMAVSSLRPRSLLPRGDGTYVGIGVAVALAMQSIGWSVPTPERAVLVRLVTIACGLAVLGATTSIALARHAPRSPASRALRIRRALPWIVMLALVVGSGIVVSLTRWNGQP